MNDLDRVIEAVEVCRNELASVDCHCIVDTGSLSEHVGYCAANNAQKQAGEALTLLRQMRENAVEGAVMKDEAGDMRPGYSVTFWPHERPVKLKRPALLIVTPEDE